MKVEATRVAPDIVRVGVFPDGMPPDYRSEAVVLESEGGAVDVSQFTFSEHDGRFTVSAPKLAGERFFACGERTSGLEKTGTCQVFCFTKS